MTPRPEDVALLPCPFCNCPHQLLDKTQREGYAEFPNDPDAYAFNVRCPSCGATGGWAKSESGARRWWNMREWKPGASRLEGEGRDGERLAEATAILRQIYDEDDCVLDHHGHCQAHGWPYNADACPHARAKAFLSAPASSPQPTTTTEEQENE